MQKGVGCCWRLPRLTAEDALCRRCSLQEMLFAHLHPSADGGSSSLAPEEFSSTWALTGAPAMGWAKRRLQRQGEQRGRGLEPSKSGHVFFFLDK